MSPKLASCSSSARRQTERRNPERNRKSRLWLGNAPSLRVRCCARPHRSSPPVGSARLPETSDSTGMENVCDNLSCMVSARTHTHTHTHVFCVPGSFLQLISLHLLAVDAANVLFTAFPYPSVLCLIPELYFRQKTNYFTCELVLNISHVCQTGNRSVEVIQELFYTRNSSDIILGVSSHSHPGIANMFPKCPDDPRRSQHVSQRAVSCVHVCLCQSERESFHGWASFRG